MFELPDNQRLGFLAGGLLAEAAFLFTESSESFSPKGKALLFGRIPLGFSEKWELMVVTETELAESLAANLLGIDEDAEEARTSGVDALGEWLNILAGSLAAECKSADEPCRIGLPVVTSEAGTRANTFLARAFRQANLVTESGYHLAVGLLPLETA